MEQVDEIISILEGLLERNYFSTNNIHKLNVISGDKMFFKLLLEKARKIHSQYSSVRIDVLYDATLEAFEKWRNYHSVNYELTQDIVSSGSIYIKSKTIVFDRFNDLSSNPKIEMSLDRNLNLNREVEIIDKNKDITLQICILIMKMVKEMMNTFKSKINGLKNKISEKEKSGKVSKYDLFILKSDESDSKNIIKLMNGVKFQVSIDHSKLVESFTHKFIPPHLEDEAYVDDNEYKQLNNDKIEEIKKFMSEIGLMDRLGVSFSVYRNDISNYFYGKPIYGQLVYKSKN